jgi:hypothetical protein
MGSMQGMNGAVMYNLGESHQQCNPHPVCTDEVFGDSV